jgi:hypothetical protein
MRGDLMLAQLAAVSALLLSASPAAAQMIDRLDAVHPVLHACVENRIAALPPVPGRREMTFRMSFRGDGTMLGPPRRSHSFPAADRPDQAQLLAEVANAIMACMPLPFSKELGAAMAGRPFLYRLIISPRQDQRA